MQKINPFLWFDGRAEEAANFYIYGVSWQIVPTVLDKLLNDPDPIKSQRVMRAMLQMSKIDIEKLRQAYEGK